MTKSVFIATVFSTMALLGTVLAHTASAEEAPSPAENAENATTNRQAVFKLLGYNMGTIVAMAKGNIGFDAAIAERNATRIAMLAPMIPELLGAMDTRQFDVETEALPGIWDNMDEIADKAQSLIEAANTFADIAATGDHGATMGGLRAFGAACGNCHDTFRVDDD